MTAREGTDYCPGQRVARLFQILLSLSFLVAWLSLGSQIDLLIGHRGLLPVAELVEQLQRREIGLTQFPSLLFFDASDGALHGIVIGGVLCSLASWFGAFPRLAFAFNTLLYLSVATAGQNFLTFQWDNLLLECGLLASLLDTARPQRWLYFLLRVLLFKLYFESGIAKYQSHLGDWKDGSAMSFYYETAPIPTALAWYMHQLPAVFHQFESWLTLAWEIAVPFAIFGPRPARLGAFVVFAGFQFANILTANYGFFSYLALVLQVLLLCDRDVQRVDNRLHRIRARWFSRRSLTGAALTRGQALRRLALLRLQHAAQRVSRLLASGRTGAARGLRPLAVSLFSALYLAVSLHGGLQTFWPHALPDDGFFQELTRFYTPYRLVNVYHLFGHITRDRIEAEFQVMPEDQFEPLSLHHKPGPLDRAPPFVAPHQPRVDFLLWFYGLSARRGPPRYVQTLLHRLCDDPRAVQPLFVEQLPRDPRAVRVTFSSYRFTSREERARSSNWWKRQPVGTPVTLGCSRP